LRFGIDFSRSALLATGTMSPVPTENITSLGPDQVTSQATFMAIRPLLASSKAIGLTRFLAG
jgi:hypothetical protein